MLGFHLLKPLSDKFYFRSGFSYVHKQVQPQENTNVYYKDQLKSGYVSVPALLGTEFLLEEGRPVTVSLEFGPAFNFRVMDKSYFGPDRVETMAHPATGSLNPAAGLSWDVGRGLKMTARYSYMVDVTHAYTETLYWGSPDQPYRDFHYQWKTHVFSLGGAVADEVILFPLGCTSKGVRRETSEVRQESRKGFCGRGRLSAHLFEKGIHVPSPLPGRAG